MTEFKQQFGILRRLLLASSLLCLLLIPWMDTSLPTVGWGIFFGAALPAIIPLLVMLLCLDAIMARVMASNMEPASKQALHKISILNIIVAIVLLLAWLPVFGTS